MKTDSGLIIGELDHSFELSTSRNVLKTCKEKLIACMPSEQRIQQKFQFVG
jgi:hypothetical protein